MGLPAVLVVMAENQQLVAERMAEEGGATNLGWHENLASDKTVEAMRDLLCSVKEKHI